LAIAHDPWLVALSILIAMLGGYVGLGLAVKVRETAGLRRRWLLAGGAWALALGIWTMHFTGILAAEFPVGVVYRVFPTLLSFLLCVLVVGVAVFLVSLEAAGLWKVAAGALTMGAGIVTMHFVGMSALTGTLHQHHDQGYMAASALIAVAVSGGVLWLIVTRRRHPPVALSAAGFGLAVSGMHYTAMAGMAVTADAAAPAEGLVMSAGSLAIIVAILAFTISGCFLLFLVPEPREKAAAPADEATGPLAAGLPAALAPPANRNAPLLGALPVEREGTRTTIPVGEVRSIQANAHYTLVFDGRREYLSPWSISEAETQLDSQSFMRVHRSHLVALSHVRALRRERDGGVVELDGGEVRTIPVSRARYNELRVRLGASGRGRAAGPIHKMRQDH
jgi:diguanylate cyclase